MPRLAAPFLLIATMLALPAASQNAGDDLAALRAEMAQMRAEIATLRAQSQPSWLDEARAAEVRSIVDQALADAQSRSGLGSAALGAGYDGKHFFLQGDGFRVNIGGQIQFRGVNNFNDGRTAESQDLHGFEIRRAKIQFDGYIADPKLTYVLRIVNSRSNANTSLEEARIGYTFDNGLKVFVGKMKLPFLRQELLSSKRQLAVDRGLSTEFFTLNFAEQVQVQVPVGDNAKFALAYSDGGNTESSSDTAITTEYAFTGRADFKLAGNWKQSKDLVAFDDDLGLFVGAALHDEKAELSGETTLAWTADALVKRGNASAMLAYMGAQGDLDSRTLHGLLAEAGYSVTRKFQPFVRYEWIDDDTAADPLQAATAGFNYFLKGHQAKFTTDIVYQFAGDNPTALPGLNGGEFSSGIGLSSAGVSDSDDQIALRAQMQLLF